MTFCMSKSNSSLQDSSVAHVGTSVICKQNGTTTSMYLLTWHLQSALQLSQTESNSIGQVKKQSESIHLQHD